MGTKTHQDVVVKYFCSGVEVDYYDHIKKIGSPVIRPVSKMEIKNILLSKVENLKKRKFYQKATTLPSNLTKISIHKNHQSTPKWDCLKPDHQQNISISVKCNMQKKCNTKNVTFSNGSSDEETIVDNDQTFDEKCLKIRTENGKKMLDSSVEKNRQKHSQHNQIKYKRMYLYKNQPSQQKKLPEKNYSMDCSDQETTDEDIQQPGAKYRKISRNKNRLDNKINTSSGSKGIIRSESPLTLLAKREVEKYFDPTELEYHPNMARKYSDADNRTPEQEEYRRKNSLAARVSRNKAKEIEKQQVIIAKRTTDENQMLKSRLAARVCYVNKLCDRLGRKEIDFVQLWRMNAEEIKKFKAELLKEFARHKNKKNKKLIPKSKHQTDDNE